jgi:reverse transcriptase-like protein
LLEKRRAVTKQTSSHEKEFFSESGVQQGDPLGPLYFCCGLQTLIDQIASLHPVYQKWYMDDGGIVGSPELLMKVWDILKEGGVPLGLVLNPQKCEWSWLRADCKLPSPIDGVPITPTDEIQILGVPLGSQDFIDQERAPWHC